MAGDSIQMKTVNDKDASHFCLMEYDFFIMTEGPLNIFYDNSPSSNE